MNSNVFSELSHHALSLIDDRLGELEHEALDPELAADVLTLYFQDGTRFVINAHSAARQIWMAAGSSAWHFDFVDHRKSWIAAKSGDELMSTVARIVGEKLGKSIQL
ncbi:MAG: iron donor protein CyaY [Nannocystaceae bacterium]